MKTRFVILSLLCALVLSGCVAVWGKSYNIALANSQSVVIEYDPAVVNLPALLAEAQANCDRFGKDAVLNSVTTGNLGIIVNTYRCETRTADKVKETSREKGFSTGTGFFVSSSGHLVTSFHVIDGAKEIIVRTYSRLDLPAVVIAGDPANDVALLKVNAQTAPVPLGAASEVAKGSEVMTLGYPLVLLQGQDQKATFGRVNALSGAGNDIRFLQIDVPVQPGNSGAPLIGKNGNVVGVVTATLDEVTALKKSGHLPQNVNYAVKIEYVLPLLTPLPERPRKMDANQVHRFEDLIRMTEESVVFIIAR